MNPSPTDNNPLLQPWTGEFGLPPFAAVRAEHFVPAFELAMRTHLEEVAAIGSASDAPNFANTIAALDRAGRLFDRISGLFHNLTSSETSPALQAIERQMAPLLAAHESRVSMDRPLFARIDALHKRRHELGLGAEQLRALERYHTDFVRAGARMGAAEQKRYAEVMQRLADLTTRFGQNVLADESGFQLVLNGEAELAGLPGFVRTAARQAAVDRGVAADGVVTLSRSHIVPFLTFSERRDLREQAWRAWTSRGEHEGASDNRGVAAEILALRLEQARLHGYASYADYALADTMAGSQEAVTSLLMQVWKPAQARALAEREALEALALSRGEPATIEPWDWRFHAEKVRRVRFHLDEAAVKPYFALERITEAAFDCAGRLFGVSFVPRPEIAVYHPDVKVYEVRGADGAAIGLFLHDNFARPTKRSGAWMGAYRMQSKNGGSGGDASVLPIIVNNNNFAKGAPGEPTLLSFDDARTLFHEFGHG
ncbi:MAG: M3 family metallopeptidase, partial [Caldimonas sp.]